MAPNAIVTGEPCTAGSSSMPSAAFCGTFSPSVTEGALSPRLSARPFTVSSTP